jgi:RNase H-fold protein (predicted Holliday junction resolvase)
MEADMSRAKRIVTIDKVSAVFILQGVLDRLRAMDGVGS